MLECHFFPFVIVVVLGSGGRVRQVGQFSSYDLMLYLCLNCWLHAPNLMIRMTIVFSFTHHKFSQHISTSAGEILHHESGVA